MSNPSKKKKTSVSKDYETFQQGTFVESDVFEEKEKWSWEFLAYSFSLKEQKPPKKPLARILVCYK